MGVTSLLAAITAHREGNVLLGRGVTFGIVAVSGAAADTETGQGRRPGWDDPSPQLLPDVRVRVPPRVEGLRPRHDGGPADRVLGVGFGFLVVPTLLLAVALPMEYAAGNNLNETAPLQSGQLGLLASGSMMQLLGATPATASPTGSGTDAPYTLMQMCLSGLSPAPDRYLGPALLTRVASADTLIRP